MFRIEEVIDMAVRFEENAAQIYTDALAKIDAPAMHQVLEEMIAEERQHAEWFGDLRRRLADPEVNPIERALNREMLGEMIGDQSFSLREVDFEALDGVDALIDVLIEFEKDTILFYEMIQGFLPDADARAQLEQIIAEEKRHITRLAAMRPSSAPPEGMPAG